MSKKMSEINDNFIEKAEHARRTMNNATRISATFPEIEHIIVNEEITLPNGDKTSIEKENYYMYNGARASSPDEANSFRNTDIESKVGILDSKISDCNSRKNELNNVKSDCETSISVLNSDVGKLTSAQSQIQDISSAMSSTMNMYNEAMSTLNYTYKCTPQNLSTGTSSAIGTTTKSFSNDSISSGISTLKGWVDTGEDIKSGITSLIGEIEEKISDLQKQIDEFNAMKH